MIPVRQKTRHPGIYYREMQGGRRYIVWYADADGKGHYETLPAGSKLEDAVNRRADLTAKRARGEAVAPTTETISELADRFLEECAPRLKPKTVETYRWAVDIHIKPKLGRKRAAKLTVDDVAWFIRQLEREGKKAWSIRACLSPLSRMMALIGRRGAANPVRALDRGERPRNDARKMAILNTEEISKLLDSATSDRYRLFLATAVFTGLRLGELLALRWGDVDFERQAVIVRSSKTESGEREVVITPSLVVQLRRHKLASGYSQTGDFVFVSQTGGPWHIRNARRRAFEAACEAAGIEGVRFHDLRHTYASLLIAQGEDATYVSDQMGHSSPMVTYRVYAKLFDPARRRDEARGRLEQAFGGVM